MPGTASAILFVGTVLVAHRSTAWVCARNRTLRHLLRGRPRALVRDGALIAAALRDEGVSVDELLAGLRKLGFDSPDGVKLAVLEETGHISAIAADERLAFDAAAGTDAAATAARTGHASGQNGDQYDDRDRDAQQP